MEAQDTAPNEHATRLNARGSGLDEHDADHGTRGAVPNEQDAGPHEHDATLDDHDAALDEHDAGPDEHAAGPDEQDAGPHEQDTAPHELATRLDTRGSDPDEQNAGLNEQDAGLDEQERIEAAWLLAREEDPGAPSPSPEVAHEYAILEELLETLPLGDLEDDWQDAVLRAAKAVSFSGPDC